MKRLLTLIALLACLATVVAEPITVTDDFETTAPERWDIAAGDWQVRDGAYHVSGTGQAYLRDINFGDLTLDVDVRITDYGAITADWLGVVFGGNARTRAADQYMVYLRWNGQIELYRLGQILAVAPTNSTEKFKAGEYVHLALRVHDDEITVTVDGEEVFREPLPGYKIGQVALTTYDIEGDFDNFNLRGDAMGSAITGQVLYLPTNQPAAGVTVEIYNSMGGYDSPVTRETTSDEEGRFAFTDLPPAERAYWVRACKPGYGGTTGWFLTVEPQRSTVVDLYLVGTPQGAIRIDSADATQAESFTEIPDPQSIGGSRLELRVEQDSEVPADFRASFDFDVAHDGAYTPYIAGGLYPTPHYWSDYWWRVDDGDWQRAGESLSIEPARYGDRATLVWARAKAQGLTAGKHTLEFAVRDTIPHPQPEGTAAYAWAFDAAVFDRVPEAVRPLDGETVSASFPEFQWAASGEGALTTLQYSQEPDFHNATETIAGLTSDTYTPAVPLADGKYYWRLKTVSVEDSLFASSFTSPAAFTIETGAPGISGVRVVRREPTSVEIRWRTDEPCVSSVAYGRAKSAPQRSVTASSTPRRLHRARIDGLEPMTYYYFWVQATDADGNQSRSLRRGVCTLRGVIADHNSPFGMFGQTLIYVDAMSKAGVRWYSDYWSWQSIEPARGTFVWTEPEERMARAEAADMNLTVTFWGTPPWVRPSHPGDFTFGPDDLQDATDFFSEVAGHCRGRTDWWIPWIEPNVARDPVFGFPLGYWASRPHARSYTAYQRAAYTGAKAGDPDCTVVGMNTAGVDLGFIGRCYDEGAGDTFDVMNVHYYAVTAPFEEQRPEMVFAQLRALMSEYGDSEKPIICSEGGGASSNQGDATEDTQADNLIRIYVISIANNIDKLCWTFDRDVKPYDSTRVDMIMWMGLFRYHPDASVDNPCGEPKPSYQALKTMADLLRGTSYVGPIRLGAGLRAYRFEAPERNVTVAWAENDTRAARVPVKAPTVAVIDRTGASRTVETADGALNLELTGSPVFIVEQN